MTWNFPKPHSSASCSGLTCKPGMFLMAGAALFPASLHEAASKGSEL